MFSVRKLLDPKTPTKVCLRSYELFLEGLDSTTIVDSLKREGFTERIAARAVTFLSSAFARVHYEKQGLFFPSYFYPGFSAYQKGRIRRYADEPVFQAAMQLAEQLSRDGDRGLVWLIIEISAEHRSIEAIKHAGQTPTSVTALIYNF